MNTGVAQHRSSIQTTRRELLRVGGLTLLGLTSNKLNALRAAAPDSFDLRARRHNACVFIFLFGGPSHIDLWDMKPQAPDTVRGEFRPAATKVPGIQICEHLPHLAEQMDKLCLLRSMTHHMPVHGPACSEMYSGREYFGPPITDQARAEDWPSIASLVARYAKSPTRLPQAVVLPWYSQFDGQERRIAGQTAGRMGERFNPVLIQGEPERADFQVPGLQLSPDVNPSRIASRRLLLKSIDDQLHNRTDYGASAMQLAEYTETAYSMLQQPHFARALDLSRADESWRTRYGYSRFGQSLLLARRLIETGVSLVTVNWDDTTKTDKVSPFWDTHHDNFKRLKDHLCPMFDQAFSTFLIDLAESGLLESTLVVVTGEFGRTPRIGEFTQNNMTQKTGRDHWPHAFTVLLAGGGVRGGQVYGATEKDGGHVLEKPISPADLSATILWHLGVDPQQKYFDEFQNVPQRLSSGKAIRDLD